MGYEVTFLRSDDPIATDNDVIWFACGWDKVDLFKALLSLGKERSRAYDDGYVVKYGDVAVSDLSFVRDIESRVCDDARWSRYRKLFDIDEVLADDWYGASSADMRADMALSFFGDIDRSCGHVMDVSLLLYRHCVEYPWFVHGLADAVKSCEEDGVERVFVFGG